MNEPAPSEKTVNITVQSRAIRQDAELAMSNRPISGLIELITNSDDAYGESSGKITMQIGRNSSTDTWWFSVSDKAKGMSYEEMVHKLLNMGGQVSGHETGERVRGNLGRGAKDVAVFGTASYESINNDRYVKCEISRDSMDKGEFTVLPRPATTEDRKSLGIHKDSGMVVTVTVTNGTPRPHFETLKRDLQRHFQLRDILVADNREVRLIDHIFH